MRKYEAVNQNFSRWYMNVHAARRCREYIALVHVNNKFIQTLPSLHELCKTTKTASKLCTSAARENSSHTSRPIWLDDFRALASRLLFREVEFYRILVQIWRVLDTPSVLDVITRSNFWKKGNFDQLFSQRPVLSSSFWLAPLPLFLACSKSFW
jgi:hypothetical protein